MTGTDTVTEYLTKEIVVNKNIVTYRSLSRALGIHVNTAKNELARYHAAFCEAPERACASFMISGTPHPRTNQLSEDGTTNKDESYVADNDPATTQTQITIVAEAALEETQSNYQRIFSTFVYSLSPAPIREPALICEPTRIVYKADKENGSDYALLVGRITGVHVIHGPLPKSGSKAASTSATAAPSKGKLPSLAKSATILEPAKTTEENAKSVVLKAPSLKPKASGKIEFSKKSDAPNASLPPAKELKKKAEQKAVAVKEENEEEEALPAMKVGPPRGKKKTEVASTTRGTKRKSAMQLSDSEDDSPPPSTSKKLDPPPKSTASTSKSQPVGVKRAISNASARTKKGAILSSDEEEVAAAPTKPRKQTAAEKALSAMMDVDDNTVEVISRKRDTKPMEDDDVEMAAPEQEEEEDEPVPKAKPQRKPKKVIPVGRNGIKKRRVLKSRTAMDDKGFVVTEDYSSYESADEDDKAPSPGQKQKGKASSVEKTEPVKEAKAAPKKKAAAPPVKRTGQSSIQNFFGKK